MLLQLGQTGEVANFTLHGFAGGQAAQPCCERNCLVGSVPSCLATCVAHAACARPVRAQITKPDTKSGRRKVLCPEGEAGAAKRARGGALRARPRARALRARMWPIWGAKWALRKPIQECGFYRIVRRAHVLRVATHGSLMNRHGSLMNRVLRGRRVPNFELCPAPTFYAFHDRGSVMGTDPYEAIGWALMATGWIAVKCERGAHFEIS